VIVDEMAIAGLETGQFERQQLGADLNHDSRTTWLLQVAFQSVRIEHLAKHAVYLKAGLLK
jgi:hypothetical protein